MRNYPVRNDRNFGLSAFDDFFRPFFGFENESRVMNTDISEKDGNYVLDIDLPGFKKDEVNVQLEDGYLTVSAAKGLDKDEKKKGRYIRQERYAGQCSRSFYVGESVKPKDVHAKFEDGILKLSLPKAEQPKLPDHRTITIE